MNHKNNSIRRGNLLLNPRTWKIIFPLILAVVTLVAGSIGLCDLTRDTCEEICVKMWEVMGNLIGQTNFIDLNEKETIGNACLVWLARITGLLLIGWAFVMIVWGEYGDTFKRLRISSWRMRKKSYVVICGAGVVGSELARHLLSVRRHVVIIEKNPDCHALAELRLCGAVVFIGDATEALVLEKAGVGTAKEMYVFCGDDATASHVVHQVERSFGVQRGGCQHLEKKKDEFTMADCSKMCTKRFMVHVGLEQRSYRMAMMEGSRSRQLAIHGFSFDEQVARSLFLRHSWVPVRQSNGKGARHVHSIVFGATGVARAIVLQNLRMLHLLEVDQRKVTVICEHADEVRERFLSEYPCLKPSNNAMVDQVEPNLFPALDFVELPQSPAEMRTTSFSPFQDFLAGWRMNVFFCLDDGVLSQGCLDALKGYLVWRKEQAGSDCELFLACSRGKTDAIEEEKMADVVYFGNQRFLCTPAAIKEPDADRLAKAMMLIYVSDDEKKEFAKYCEKPYYDCVVNRKWAVQLKEWERQSNRQVADHVGIKLALLGLGQDKSDGQRLRTNLEDSQKCVLETLARVEHRRWCAERLLGGWLPFPAEYDRTPWFKRPEDRTEEEKNLLKRYKDELQWHADLIPFDDLPEWDKTRDYAIIRFIPGVLENRASITRYAVQWKSV